MGYSSNYLQICLLILSDVNVINFTKMVELFDKFVIFYNKGFI